jgi:hypothetical protein
MRLVNISLSSGNCTAGLSVLTAEVEYNQRDRKRQVMKEKDVAGGNPQILRLSLPGTGGRKTRKKQENGK